MKVSIEGMFRESEPAPLEASAGEPAASEHRRKQYKSAAQSLIDISILPIRDYQ
jgi:hypothetical protein